MSADNGIYIAEFSDGFRVVHAMAIDNLSYYSSGSEEERQKWQNCFSSSVIWATREEVEREAFRLLKEHTKYGHPVEYGICDLGRGVDFMKSTPTDPYVYGYCPDCGAPGVRRERRPDGNTTCYNGHTHLSKVFDSTKSPRELTIPLPSSFPVHYEDKALKIYTNSSGELFVENKKTGVKMRINATQEGLEYTAASHKVQPIVINGLIGWDIR